MPIIELPTLSYDDDQQKLIDKLNDALRQLDWLLNRGRLDAQNINQTVIQIQPEDPEKPQPVDDHGLNALYLDYYPNKCFNSSFEVFDSDTKKPKYWDTSGEVSPDAEFDNSYSLKLTSGQYAEQAEDASGKGLVDPAWWPWCNGRTRIAFYAKGEGGKVRVSVWQGSNTVPLAYWTKNNKGEDVEVQTQPPHYLEFDAGLDWPNAMITFAALPSVSGGKIKLRIENTGSVDVYIDAVLIRADWTGKWPGLYKHGPESGGAIVAGEEYIEYASADWNSNYVEFTLVNGYTDEPVATVSVQGDPDDFVGSAFVLVIKHIQEIISGQLCYSKIQVYPKGSSLPTPTGAKITLQAICRGKVSKT